MPRKSPHDPRDEVVSVTPAAPLDPRAVLASRLLGAVVAAQVLGLLAVAVVVATHLFRGGTGDGRVPPVLADLAATLVGAAVVGSLGRSVAGGGRSLRGALFTVEILCIPVGFYAVAGGRPEVGLPVALLGVLGIVGIVVVAGTSDDD